MDTREFRNAMGKFATGVTVIATQAEDHVHGMTANAFMSVSLDPKLIMISIDNNANMLDKIKGSGQFSVNVLSEEQREVSRHFAGQEDMEDDVNFAYIEHIPVIKDSLVSVACDVHDTIVAGDHTLFIGSVRDILQTDGDPLTFFCGKYGAHSIVS